MKKKKLSIVWSCSDWVRHEHKTWLGAWLCGHWQRLTKRALDAANADAELFHSVIEMVNPNNPHWHKPPRQ